jgi:hypothetical protein
MSAAWAAMLRPILAASATLAKMFLFMLSLDFLEA